MDNEILRAAARKRGVRSRPRSGPSSGEVEPPRKRVCDLLGAPRSTIYAREGAALRDESGVVPSSSARQEAKWIVRAVL